MPVPLEDYTVREAGLVSYDTLNLVAKKYGTTAQALRYFNRSNPEVAGLKTGEGLAFASKIDPSKVPTLKVPKSVTGGSSTNQQTGSVSRTSYSPVISKLLILKRIKASYGTALANNIPFLRDKSGWEYLHSSKANNYHNWRPIYNMLDEMRSYANSPAAQTHSDQQKQNILNYIYINYTNHWAKVFRVKKTEAERFNYFGITDTNNPTQTPADSDQDKKKVLEIIEKLVDLENQGDSYGHWWLEIYHTDIRLLPKTVDDTALYTSVAPTNLRASYGFWPLQGAKLGGGAVTGSVLGGINNNRGQDSFRNTLNLFDINDPAHQYDPYADKTNISWKVDLAYFATDPYGRPESEIYDDILEYLSHYPSDMEWAWPDTNEKQEHCQTFQKELLAACGLVAAPGISKDQFPPLDKYKLFWGMEFL